MKQIHITQGEYATGDDRGTVISTLLGSCVSCCLWDLSAGVGGMNHILHARVQADDPLQNGSGINTMEVLINALIKLGATRSNLKAKAFGGAQMVSGLSDIGEQNTAFITNFLAQEGIPLITQSFGGHQARNLKFWPTSGRVMQKLTDVEVRWMEIEPSAQSGHEVGLF
ncbi:chemotaxis protein CheD [Tateyamaria sp.]|uniref:chemotaxis protein CheD n=1 Tax=Tateyamaria sp. TaxID=1929288 RepID=UPI00329A8BC8